jgi:predicted enzyme related to lactoylglutathione lyase
MGRGAFIRDPQGARLGLFCAKPGATDGTNPTGAGAPCWMELLTSDVPAAVAFYTAVLGWSIVEQVFPFGTVHVAQAGPTHVCSIFPRPARDRLAHNRWYPYFQVANIEHAHKRLHALGGMEAAPLMPIPTVGRWFPASDAVGAEVAFMELEPRA